MNRDTLTAIAALSIIGLALLALVGAMLVVGYRASHGSQRPFASATCDPGPQVGYNSLAECQAALALLGNKGHCAVVHGN